AVKTKRMEYVGYNFGPEAPRVSSLCQYFVGVLNKKTKCMKLHKTQLFNLRPVIEVTEKESTENETTYKQKVNFFLFCLTIILSTSFDGINEIFNLLFFHGYR
ncbi:DNA-directed RNA polymerase I subunit RPA49-like, partial [Centruroides sculpturatus]|uniref:DNA-directed RNA polymerase I subunit RPA49-like n=1 Tax=Centruroides sculpturatus TaxID=218467 RepID=UPI000C6E752D